MTATYAYDNHLPCLNPKCKSHGKPHPNCRCYGSGGMAAGGEVGGFCSAENEHSSDCEYFVDGVIVGDAPNWDSLSTVKPEEAPAWDSLSATPSWDTLSTEQPAATGHKQDLSKYDTTEQQIKTGLEGAAQGLAGPLATYAETHLLGVSPEDIKGRAEANPWIHGGAEAATLVGGLLTGTGEAGLIAKGAGAVSEAANLGKLGSAALKGFIEGASFAGSDEITKAMLNQPGSDPEVPLSAALLHVGASGLVGGLSGGVFSLGEGMIGKGLESLESQKVVNKVQDLLSELGGKGNPLSKLKITDRTAGTSAAAIAKTIEVHTGLPLILTYGSIKKAIRPLVEKIIKKPLGAANEYVTDAVIKSLLTNESSGAPNAIHYAGQILKGVRSANKGMDALFKIGGSQLTEPTTEKERQSLDDFIAGGQTDMQMQNSMSAQPEGFASGGMVSKPSSSFSTIFPEQNMLLSAAKGRISGYLNSIRPTSNQPKLAFDSTPPQTDKKRAYQKALDYAVRPMSILDKVNKGNLTPEDMTHFTSLYPEAHRYLSQEMTKRITQAQLNGEKPAYKKRQSMSLFLGADLDSTFTPAAISTIQGIYAMQKGKQQQQVQGNKKAMSKSSNQYQTDEQAREKRMQNQKA